MVAPRKIISLVAASALLATIVAGAVWFWSSRRLAPAPETAGRQPAQPPDREAAHLVERKNTALAALENGDFQTADPILLELATAGTGEPVGVRNWLINRVLTVEAADTEHNPQSLQVALDRARDAVNLEWGLEHDGPMRSFLASKIYFRSDNAERGLSDLHIAITRALDDPIIWTTLYHAERGNADQTIREDGDNAIYAVYNIVPDNLHALLEWMALQARRKDPDIARTVDRARGLFTPLLNGNHVTAAKQPEIAAQLNAVAAAAKSGDWNAVTRDVAAIAGASSALRAVQADKRRLNPSLLWYSPNDFSENYYEKHRLARKLGGEPIAVRFREIPMPGPLADVVDVRDAKFVDFDLDGRLDIVLLRASSLEIFRHSEKGNNWSRLATVSVPDGGFQHILPVDLDDDTASRRKGDARKSRGPSADPDLILFGSAGVLVVEDRLEADGKTRSLLPVDSPGLTATSKEVAAVAAVDLDNDGLLDLVVAQGSRVTPNGLSVWRNRGHCQFEEITSRIGPLPAPMQTKSLIAVDWNRDLDPDLMITSGSGSAKFGFLKGRGEGRFRFQPIKEANSRFESATTLAVLDADANGSWDLLAAGRQGISLLRTQCLQANQVNTLDTTDVSDFPAERLLAFDYDNDGCQDLLAWNGDAVQVLHGQWQGRFAVTGDLLPASLKSIRSADCGDVDMDGDLDLLVVTAGEKGGRVQILQNVGGNANHWIDVRLDVGASSTPPGPSEIRINPMAIGSMLQLKTGAVCQSRIVGRSVTHFGLGNRESAKVLRIVWTSGVATNVLEPAKNRTLTERPTLRVLAPDDSATKP